MSNKARTVPKKIANSIAPAKVDRKKSKQADAAPDHLTRSSGGASTDSIYTDTLRSYLTGISRYRLLTRDEEQDLFRRLHGENDSQAAQALVTSNLRLVVKIALDYKRLWMQNLLDLIQEGNIGLIKAVEKFDPNKNVKFSYYASFWIKAFIIKHLMDNWRLVKIGTTQAQRKLFFKLKKEKQRLREMGFEPKPELLSKRLGVSKKEVVEMDQRMNGWDVSLDAPLTDGTGTARIEFVKTSSNSLEDQISKKEIEAILHRRIAQLKLEMNPRELDIFNQRIFTENPKTLSEIGKQYGISRERVRQIQKNIIIRMKKSFEHTLPDYAVYSEGGSSG